MIELHRVVNIWTRVGMGGARLAHASNVYEDPRVAIVERDVLPDEHSWELVGTYHPSSSTFLSLKELERLSQRYVEFRSLPNHCGEIPITTQPLLTQETPMAEDHDAQDIRLDDSALEQATIAAGAAVHAGLEEHEQLVHGIRAYLHDLAERHPALSAILVYDR